MQTVIVVALAALAMFGIERLRPGVQPVVVRGWWWRVVLLNAIQVGVVFVGALTWDRWLPQWRLMDGSVFGTWGGAAIGYLAVTFVYYGWHRARHEVPLLWRWLHQVHHSPQRLEVVTSFYKHPAEMLINALLNAALLYVVLGLSPEAVALTVLMTGLAELFYHWNVRTPYWLGFVIQRPESHRRHHQRGWHRQNYSDLPLWDWMFGTLCNPRETPVECGFANDAETRLGALLVGRRPR